MNEEALKMIVREIPPLVCHPYNLMPQFLHGKAYYVAVGGVYRCIVNEIATIAGVVIAVPDVPELRVTQVRETFSRYGSAMADRVAVMEHFNERLETALIKQRISLSDRLALIHDAVMDIEMTGPSVNFRRRMALNMIADAKKGIIANNGVFQRTLFRTGFVSSRSLNSSTPHRDKEVMTATKKFVTKLTSTF